jgi:hypothetical protein
MCIKTCLNRLTTLLSLVEHATLLVEEKGCKCKSEHFTTLFNYKINNLHYWSQYKDSLCDCASSSTCSFYGLLVLTGRVVMLCCLTHVQEKKATLQKTEWKQMWACCQTWSMLTWKIFMDATTKTHTWAPCMKVGLWSDKRRVVHVSTSCNCGTQE